MTERPVRVERERHGPFERVVFTYATELTGQRAQLSVYRLGDTLFDTGSTHATEALLRVLDEHPPKRIVLTHQHEDHIGNAMAIRRRFGHVPVYAPRVHLEIIANFTTVPPLRGEFWGPPEPVPDAIGFDPGDTITEGSLTLHALETPGHTPGHIAWMCEHDGLTYALSGDLYTTRPLEAWYESACDDMIRSYRLLARHGDALRMLPTHGRTRDESARVLSEAAAFLEQESERVEDTARSLGTRDALTVSHALYGDDPTLEISSGEIGHAPWVRSVLSPVKTLPATALLPVDP